MGHNGYESSRTILLPTLPVCLATRGGHVTWRWLMGPQWLMRGLLGKLSFHKKRADMRLLSPIHILSAWNLSVLPRAVISLSHL